MPTALMLLSNPYRPDPRVLIEGRALVGAGISVKLIAWDREGSRPGRASEDGIDIIRLGPRARSRSPKDILTRLPRFWLRALRESRILQFDLVHAHDFDMLPIGHLISRLHQRPVLYDAHELYAKMIEGDIGALSRLIWIWERFCARRADAVITVSDALADELSTGREDRARVVSTSQDPSALECLDAKKLKEEYGLKGFVVSYLGSLEPGRFVEELLAAFAPEDGITVLIAGSGTLQPTVERAAATNPVIRFIGVVDTDEALRLTFASDLVVAMMDPSNSNNRVGTPGKILNALACGRPMITNEGLQIAEKIKKARAGVVVPYEGGNFKAAVLTVSRDPKGLEAMGREGRKLYEAEFSSERSRKNLLEVYNGLLKSERA